MIEKKTDIEFVIIGCRKGDRYSQKELYKMFYSFCMGICIRYANDRMEASEIMNDGFLKAFKHINHFDMDKPLKPWLGKIMVNAAIDHYNKQAKYRAEVDLGKASNLIVNENALDTISYEEILEIIKKLPDAYRTVFNLIAIEGYTHKQVSERLGISEGTSKSNYSRAKQKLQELMVNYFEVN